MAYSTPAMVRKAALPTGDGSQASPPNTHTVADLDDATISDFIAEADAMIDSYIGGFYTVPVALVTQALIDSGLGGGAAVGAVPHPVDYWSRNLALFYASASLRGSQDFAETDPIARRYDATMNALKAVSAGTVKLSMPDNTTSAAAVGAGNAVNPTYVGNLFDARDFNLHPIPEEWPLLGDLGVGRGWGW